METEGTGKGAWSLTGTEDSDDWHYDPQFECPRVDFPTCPICGADGSLTDEHVPPDLLGGAVLTRTCPECNNRFGTYEDALLKHAEQRYTMALRSPGLRGERRISDVILRRDSDGRLLLSTWNGFWPSWTDPMFTEEGWEFQLERPCPCRAYASVLKSAYLAACTLAPEAVAVPGDWPVAELVRRQLVAWRDAHDEHLVLSPWFNRLHVRYHAPRLERPAVLLCQATHRETGERRQVLRLGWQLVIDWPIDAARLTIAS
jgi:hypothetical protein